MSGYGVNLEQASIENTYFRRVLFTGPKSQLVLMALQPGEDIGLEMHPNTDQFIRVDSGRGSAVIDGQHYDLQDGSAIVIPAGAEHNVINTSQDAMLKLYTIYAPPEYPDGTVHKTRAEAQAAHYHERVMRLTIQPLPNPSSTQVEMESPLESVYRNLHEGNGS